MKFDRGAQLARDSSVLAAGRERSGVRRKATICALFGALALSPFVSDAEVIGAYSVSTIEVSETGIYFLVPAGISAFPNPSGCAHPNWIAFDPATPLANRALAVGMAAQATGRKVRFNISGCHLGHIKAVMIQIDP